MLDLPVRERVDVDQRAAAASNPARLATLDRTAHRSPYADDAAHDAPLGADRDAIGSKISRQPNSRVPFVVVRKIAKNDAALVRKGPGFVQP